MESDVDRSFFKEMESIRINIEFEQKVPKSYFSHPMRRSLVNEIVGFGALQRKLGA